jgi:hypothetical protein
MSMSITPTSRPEKMQCMEIWGGNRAIDKSFAAPGLAIYAHSSPYQGARLAVATFTI